MILHMSANAKGLYQRFRQLKMRSRQFISTGWSGLLFCLPHYLLFIYFFPWFESHVAYLVRKVIVFSPLTAQCHRHLRSDRNRVLHNWELNSKTIEKQVHVNKSKRKKRWQHFVKFRMFFFFFFWSVPCLGQKPLHGTITKRCETSFSQSSPMMIFWEFDQIQKKQLTLSESGSRSGIVFFSGLFLSWTSTVHASSRVSVGDFVLR